MRPLKLKQLGFFNARKMSSSAEERIKELEAALKEEKARTAAAEEAQWAAQRQAQIMRSHERAAWHRRNPTATRPWEPGLKDVGRGR